MKFIPFRIFCFLFLLCVPSPVSAKMTLTDIEAYLIQKDYQAVRDHSQSYLQQDNISPENAIQARYYLALSRLNLGEAREARDLFRELTYHPLPSQLNDKVYLGLFNAYYLDGQYPEALSVIEELEQASPRTEFKSLILLKEARVRMKLTQWDEAHQLLQQIVRNYPKSLEVHAARQLLEEEHYFAVQVGAFLERKRAEELVYELNKRGQYAYIVETEDKNQRTFYRVRVGKLASLDKARVLKNSLTRVGYPARIYP